MQRPTKMFFRINGELQERGIKDWKFLPRPTLRSVSVLGTWKASVPSDADWGDCVGMDLLLNDCADLIEKGGGR